MVTEPGDVADATQPGQPSVAGLHSEPTLSVAGSSVAADVRETVGLSSDSAMELPSAELPSLVNTRTDSPAADEP